MQLENKYTLSYNEGMKAVELHKNGTPMQCRMISPLPVESSIATVGKGYSFQFFPCNDLCPNFAVRKNKESKTVAFITCGAGITHEINE